MEWNELSDIQRAYILETLIPRIRELSVDREERIFHLNFVSGYNLSGCITMTQRPYWDGSVPCLRATYILTVYQWNWEIKEMTVNKVEVPFGLTH